MTHELVNQLFDCQKWECTETQTVIITLAAACTVEVHAERSRILYTLLNKCGAACPVAGNRSKRGNTNLGFLRIFTDDVGEANVDVVQTRTNGEHFVFNILAMPGYEVVRKFGVLYKTNQKLSCQNTVSNIIKDATNQKSERKIKLQATIQIAIRVPTKV